MVLGSVLMTGAAAAQNAGQAKSGRKTGAIFVFGQDEFWLNLHHFLYVLARARKTRNATRRTARRRCPGRPGAGPGEAETGGAGRLARGR